MLLGGYKNEILTWLGSTTKDGKPIEDHFLAHTETSRLIYCATNLLASYGRNIGLKWLNNNH